MKKNMGSKDKAIRTIIAIILAILYYTETITGTFGIVILIVAAVLLITSLMNFCPLYPLIKINTTKKK